jgi:histidinol dehydrogenase
MIRQFENQNDVIQFIQESHKLNQSAPLDGIVDTLRNIEEKIKAEGDAALIHFTHIYDHVTIDANHIKVTDSEINSAFTQVPQHLVDALRSAHDNIKGFHAQQLPKSWENSPESGVRYGMKYTPINCACLYVPGGRAPYPSTVLMDAIPAKLAGVPHTYIMTPPQKDGSIAPEILVAASLCGVTDIYKVGGAQSIFASAYGTKTIPKSDKIVGPGNIYVNLAKQKVYGIVDIDKPAGPSDVLVITDEIKYAPFAASEMLAQLEHDPLSIAITLSTRPEVLSQIQIEIEAQLPTLSRQSVISKSLENSALLLASDTDELIELSNTIAAEHLVILEENYDPIFNQITNAGAIFCGPYTPVALGDYFAGPNHVLPTSGTARFASPLGIMDFMKFSTHLTYSKTALEKAAPTVKHLTDMEGFTAHYQSIDTRLRS